MGRRRVVHDRRGTWLRVAVGLIGLGTLGFAIAFPLGASAAPADSGPAVVQLATDAPGSDTTIPSTPVTETTASTPVVETTTPSTPVTGTTGSTPVTSTPSTPVVETTTPSSSLSLSASESVSTTPGGSFGLSDEVSSRPISSASRTDDGGLAGTGSPSDTLVALGIVLFLLGGLMLLVAGPRWTPRHR